MYIRQLYESENIKTHCKITYTIKIGVRMFLKYRTNLIGNTCFMKEEWLI